MGCVLLASLAVAMPAVATPAGLQVVTLAGSGRPGGSGDGGSAPLADLRSPVGVAGRASGTVVIADSGNHRVRQVRDGIISPLAGDGRPGYGGDGGPASRARLNTPTGVDLRPSGTVLVADSGNHPIRRVEKGIITTVAGRGLPGYSGDGGPASSARLRDPRGVAVRPSGELYVADSGNNAIRRVDLAGDISTVAGAAEPGYSGDGGDATHARLRRPSGVAVTPSGVLYVADTGNHAVRRIDRGVISTVAGTGSAGYAGDGGPAAAATLRHPTAVTVDASGALLIADTGNHVVRRIDTNGRIDTIAGTGVGGDGGPGGPAATTPLREPAGVGVSAEGVLVAESGTHRIRLLVQSAPVAPPTLSTLRPSSPANDNRPHVLGGAPSGSLVEIHIDPDCTAAVAAGSAEDLSSSGIAVSVADDSVTSFYAAATDAAGTVSPCAGPLTYVEDSTPPPMPRILSAPQDAGDRRPTWTFSAEPGSAVECQLAGGQLRPAFRPCEDAATYDLSAQLAGTYTFSVRATDDAGNVGPAALSTHRVVSAPPEDSDPPPPPATPGPTSPDPSSPDPSSPDPTVPSPGPAPPPGGTDPGGTGSPTAPGRPAPTSPSAGPALPAPGSRPGKAPAAPTGPRPPATVAQPSGPVPDTPADDPVEAEPDEPATHPDAGIGGGPIPPPDDRGVAGRGGRDGARQPTAPAEGAHASQHADGTASAERSGRGQAPLAQTFGELLRDVRLIAGALSREPAFPTLLVVLVVAFLAVQHWIDRKDPKLALAPVTELELDFPELLPVRLPPRSAPARSAPGGSQ